MKVKIGTFKRWFGPYQLAEALCFWVKDTPDEFGLPRKPDWVHQFGELLAHGSIAPDTKVGERSKWREERRSTWISKLLSWIDNTRPERVIKVRIDPWDTWGADHTMSYIILPLLQALRKDKSGAPWVDDEDVTEELRSTSAPELSEEDKSMGGVDDNHFKRWDYVLDEMIFAFNTKTGDDEDWEDQFSSGEHDVEWIKQEDGNFRMTNGEGHTYKVDWDARKAYQERITNGFKLFGKYYEGLWS
jgi:hypothetical protein